jgi:hypothetical protein
MQHEIARREWQEGALEVDRSESRPIADGKILGRRSLLFGATAAVAGALGLGSRAVVAADGDAVRLGRRNEASTTTAIVLTASGETALRVRAPGPGAIALEGISAQGSAMHGLSRDGNGVSGESVFGTGVSGHSIEPGSYAVSGDSTDGVGVQGGSHFGAGVQGNSQSGIAVDGGNVSETQPAVRGWAQNGQTGVMGRSTRFDEFEEVASPLHVGVFGVGDQRADTGVLARSRKGRAFEAQGRVRFATSGIAMVPAGESRVTVSPGVRIVSSAKVLATPQRDPGNHATVRFVRLDVATRTFTISMTQQVESPTPVAWFLLD